MSPDPLALHAPRGEKGGPPCGPWALWSKEFLQQNNKSIKHKHK